MGGAQKDKRMFIWDSCIEHYVRIRQQVTHKVYTNHNTLLLLRRLNASKQCMVMQHLQYLLTHRLVWTFMCVWSGFRWVKTNTSHTLCFSVQDSLNIKYVYLWLFNMTFDWQLIWQILWKPHSDSYHSFYNI